MSDSDKEKTPPPEIGPYVFPTLLMAFGLWCFYDGWLNVNPDMQEYLLINRIGSIVLLPWALIDYVRTRKKNRAEKPAAVADESDSNADGAA